MTHSLRSYQRAALDSVRAARSRGLRSCAVVLPTGSGKTRTFVVQAAEWIAEHGGRVLIIVHTEDLARQTLAQIPDSVTSGLVKAHRNETAAQVIVASRQSLGAAGERGQERRDAIEDVGLIVVDECDLAAAPQYRRIIAAYPTAFVVGYTATFMRADGKALGKVFSEIVFERDIPWGVESKHLIMPVGKAVEVPDLNIVRRRGDWTDEQVGDALVESLAPRLVAESWIEHASTRKTIGFTPTVAVAELFAAEFREHGVHAEVVHGGLPQSEREAMYDRHKPGTVLLNCAVLTVGFDRPDIDCVLVIRMTKNPRLYIQMAGRGLRVDPARPYAEQDCLIMNVTGRDIPSLKGVSVLGFEDPDEAKARKSALDLTSLLDDGGGIEQDEDPFYDGVVEVVDFDPLSGASAHVWLTTDGGTRFLPASAQALVFLHERPDGLFTVCWCSRDGKIRTLGAGYGSGGWSRHEGLTLKAAMSAAEGYVKELLGSVRSSRRALRYAAIPAYPSWNQRQRAMEYGIKTPAGITGPELSDLLDMVQGSRRIDPLVEKFKRGGR